MARAYLEPVAAGQTRFRLAGLMPDARGVVIGREALLIFESLDRLVGFLGAYSDEASLDDLMPTLTLEHARRASGGHAFVVRCAASDSYAFDRLGRLASHVGGRIYTGAGSVYLSWRTRRAPFGNDLAVPLSELGALHVDDVVAVEEDSCARYVEPRRIDPLELIQRLEVRPVALLGATPSQDPDFAGLLPLALVLVAPGLADRVLRYLWRKEVAMAATRLELGDDRQASLLLRLRSVEPEILDILYRLPGVELFAPISARAAVEIGYRHPINLAAANSCLPGDDMYLFRGRMARVERLEGAPKFVDARHLIRSITEMRDAAMEDTRATNGAPLSIRLMLKKGMRLREPRGTLIGWEQAEMLRKLIYLLPPSILGSARLCLMKRGILVLSGGMAAAMVARRTGVSTLPRVRGDASVSSYIPFGSRLCEVAPGVLVPEGYELQPRLRPELMRECLGLEEDDYAVYLRPDEEPMRVRAEQISSFDASVLGRISLQNVDVADFAESPLLPGKIANQPLSRFALWGVGGGSS